MPSAIAEPDQDLGNELKEFCQLAVRDALRERYPDGCLVFSPANIMDMADEIPSPKLGAFYTRFIERKADLVRLFGSVYHEGKKASEYEEVPDEFVSTLGYNLMRFEVVCALIYLHERPEAESLPRHLN